MVRRIHSILLLFALLLGCAGMNYVQAANVTLTVTASPAAGGKVRIANGSWTTSTNGTTSRSVPQSTLMSISAQAASGYTFSQWNDGNKNATRAVQITKNTTYTATFIPNKVTLTVTSNNTNYGTVTGGGTYNYGTSVTIKATPKTGYHFVQWSDGNTTASRSITATANASYKATFAVNTYTLTVKTATGNTTQGTVKINSGTAGASASATINHGTKATITATPKTGYHFVKWNDNNTTASRQVTVTAAKTYTATFAVNTYTITFKNGSTTLQTSTVNHGSTPSYTGSTPTKAQTAQYTYTFSGWSPAVAAATANATYTAQFSSTVRSYKVTGASANTAMGTVSGTATKQYGQTVTLTATPKSCYKFVQWNDGNTSNPRTVTVAGTKTYTATFEETINGTCGANGDNVKWYFNECTGALRIVGTGAMFAYSYFSAVPWYAYRESITSVTIANGVTSIGGCAFNCANLTTVTIPPSITSIGGNAFYGCNAMESLYITDLAAWCNINFKTEYSSPFCRNIYSSNKGGGNLYVNNTKVTTLTIPNGITSIPAFAFGGWAGTSIQFNQATNINLRAFNGCQGLTSVTIPEGVTKIGNDAFAYCANLQSITIPASVTSMGSEVLYYCSSLTDIYVSWTANVPSWPSNFTNKSPQSDITLHVPCGSGDLYRAANGWKNYTMQGSGTSNYTLTVKANNSAMGTVQIDDDAAGATVTKSVHCEDTHTLTATGIGCHYFKQWNDGNTENPRKIGIGANKTYTATFAEGLGAGTCGTLLTWYLDCNGVLTISGTMTMTNYSSGVSMPWYALKNDIKSVFIKPGVTSIGNYAFYGCTNLRSVTIPSTVATIRPGAFENCTSLTSVTIPSGVTSIGYDAFYNSGLTDIYVSWTTAEAIPTWNTMTKASQADSITLHVPCGSAEYYLAKAGWKTYKIRGGCNTTYTLTVASNNSAYGLVQMDNGTPAASISEQVYTDDSHRIKAMPVDVCHRFVQWNDGNTENPRTVMPNTNTTYTATFTDQPYSGTCGTNLTWVLECDSTLRISGTGAMTNFSSGSRPWYSIANLIKHVVIEEGVTTIGNYAFYQMDIVTVTNPSTLKTIGSQAFYRCHQLESINFPNGMTSIGSSVTGHGPFYECTSLKAIYIPASLTFINSDTFLRCYSLTSIVVDPANPKYDSRDNCNAIIETATNKLWYGCQTTVIPDGVKTVAQFAFEYQHNLKSIRISNTVTHFETYVFKECENLKDIYVEWTTTPPQDILTSWYEHENLDATITIHVPCGYESLYSSSSAWSRYQIVDDHLKGGMCGAQGSNLTWALSCDGTLTIQGIGAMKDWSVESAVPWYAYKDAIKNVVINEGVTRIGSYAFKYCNKIVNVSIPSSTTSIGIWAFDQCIGVEELHISDLTAWCTVQFESFASNPLYYAAKPDLYVNDELIVNLVIPEGVTSIYKHAFQHCSAQTITLPEGLQIIGEGNASAFAYTTISSITIPQSVTYLGRWSFTDNDNLTDIYVYWTKNIPAWNNMTNKSPQSNITLHVPCGKTAIYQAASGWKNYTITDDVTLSYSGTCGAAGHESDVTWSLDLCDSILTISGTGAMFNYTNTNNLPWVTYRDAIKTIIVEEGVTSIGSRAFGYSTNATSVSLPSSVTSIGDYAFIGCSSLQEITIPDTINALGINMLYACSSLTDIYASWILEIPAWPTNFTNNSPQSSVTLHVPCEVLENYQEANGWKDYTIEGEGTNTVTVQAEDPTMGDVSIIVN